YTYTVQNNTTSSGVFDLTTSSTLGFARTVYDASYDPISSVTLAPGEAKQVIVRVAVPGSATVGQKDIMRLTATLQGDPATTSSAIGETTVRLGLDIDPDRNGVGGAGSWVQYNHTITNSWSTTRTITLTKSSPVGWTTRIFAEDGITEILSPFEIGPFGASKSIIVRVFIPTGTVPGTVGNTTITATAPGGYTDFVTDRTTVRRLSTYADPGYLNLSSDFKLGATVFGRSTGLTPGSSVYFVWKDANGVTVRTSSLRTADTQGMAFDEYATLQSNPTGNWVVELRASGGALLETSPFVVRFDATITALSASDAPSVGSQTSITSSVKNNNTVTISDSKMTYVIWWDSNGNGTFDTGDIYINGSGAPVAWDGTSAVSTRVTSGITVPGGGTWTEPVPWTMSNTQFPNQGTYNVTATWGTSTGQLIDRKTTQFYSIPALGWPLFGLVVAGAAVLLWRRRGALPGFPDMPGLAGGPPGGEAV
ncbi:MAG: hypothetical protein U1E22_03500, partial [Coriobacteriia bacterium]|nr:hypothetical protein [Coriobacteriia bacterium]